MALAEPVQKRPRGRPRGSTSARSPAVSEGSSLRRKRYIPGGPGGGGRYVEVDPNDEFTKPKTVLLPRPRGRPPKHRSHKKGASSGRSHRAAPGPRYSSAAAAAAAVQGDAHKPREERGWEEFHPQMDIEARFPVFNAEEIDPPPEPPVIVESSQSEVAVSNGGSADRPEFPADETMLDESHIDAMVAEQIKADSRTPGLEGPSTPQRDASRALEMATPKRNQTPRYDTNENLNLLKPSFRRVDTFASYENKAAGLQRFVDRSMAGVGYQETDFFIRPERCFIRMSESTEEDLDVSPATTDEAKGALGTVAVGRVEYDMDEQDDKWLVSLNATRRAQGVDAITRELFEITMTKIEKEWYALEKRIPKPNPKPPQTQRPRSSSAAAVNGEAPGPGAGEEQDSKCAICDDGDCENTNAIVFCDGCDLAVHQECYGVPFIPEGQWLCRKCQLLGQAPTPCIFCPNIDGAFKQTNTSSWAHLLCAIWIPEVSLGNNTFMEPVMDADKIPKSRWKLNCYICRQKMGASIQCANKNCFVAFHVTCARRARLFLRMKSNHGGLATLDQSSLKAYCDKHVPTDWRRDQRVDQAFYEAQMFYRYQMRDRVWADSQASALAYANQGEAADGTGSTVASPNAKKKAKPQKPTWKLPSGAPVIPQTLYNSVESALSRFAIRKRKEFSMEACKYWTLKRESRRGAALLKRLQLQMDSFSSMEITRRDFTAMGAAGRLKLLRRIDFATKLKEDLAELRQLCENVRDREREKLAEAELLRDTVNIVYSPVTPLIWPILFKAQFYDQKGDFTAGFAELRSKLEARAYTSVSTFSADLLAIFEKTIGMTMNIEIEGEPVTKMPSSSGLTSEQKEKKRIAGRIIRMIQPLVTEAKRKELELGGGRPFEKELQELDDLFGLSRLARRDSLVASLGEDLQPLDDELQEAALNGGEEEDIEMPDAEIHQPNGIQYLTNGDTVRRSTDGAIPMSPNSNAKLPREPDLTSPPPARISHPAPLSPPSSADGNILNFLTNGGIPWYIEPFDPIGTTISEERWTGREVLRSMSEELSELDEEEMQGLEGEQKLAELDVTQATSLEKTVSKKKKGKARKWR